MSTSTPPSPLKITQRLIDGFGSAALLAALQLEVFTALAIAPLEIEQLAAALGVPARRLAPLLDVLVVLGFLRREGAAFANEADADYYLVRDKPTYFGGVHELYADIYPAVLRTADSIRADRPLAEHDFATMSDDALTAFYRGLHGMGVMQGRLLATRFDFARATRLIDVGGGSGPIAIGACLTAPALRASVVELERVAPIARRFIAEAGLSGRIDAIAGDITQQPAGAGFDIAILRSLIQVLGESQAAAALINTARSLRPGGEIYILGYVLDDDRTAPREAALFEIAFLNMYWEGRSYTEAQYRHWLGDAGFTQFERSMLPNSMSLISARLA
jgi:SAM-dependent methyltransferase